jgi:twitching motility protein PilT
MEKLNDYLRSLLSSCSDELRLEPDKNPYLVNDNTNTDVANVPLLGTQISTMVFPLIPPEVKTKLPTSTEVEFEYPHDLGNFSFSIHKSPAGFIVTIRPMLTGSGGSIGVPTPLPDIAPAYPAELGSSYAEGSPPAAQLFQEVSSPLETVPSGYELESSSAQHGVNSANGGNASPLADLLVDFSDTAKEYIPTHDDVPHLDIVSLNDPQFQTVFSDNAAYEPPGRRDDLGQNGYVPSTPDLSAFERQSYTAPHPDDVYPSTPAPDMPEAWTIVPPAFGASTAPKQAYAPTPGAAKAEFVPAPANSTMTARMHDLFTRMAEVNASDLHLSVSNPPMVRKDGKIKPLQPGDAPLTEQVVKELLSSVMPPKNQEEFAQRHDTDFAYEMPGLARFRCNVFMDRKGMGGAFRIIPAKMTTAEQLGLSQAVLDLCDLSKGLVVVTGPTGSGKSTTLCGMVNYINMRREDHIITIEDPIEFVHDNYKCLVNQREVHNHTDSFKDALRATLREDPDIILVGEMRDLETVAIAIETAETGHLVFGTLHTTTAASTVDRIIDQFPADRQQQVRVMLSESLKGVIAQTLLPKKGGGRVAALEVLIVTPAISNLIREGKTFQIPSAMQTGKNHGMVMLNDALFEHVQNGLVEPMDAYIKSVDKTGFEAMLSRGGFQI